MKKLAGLVFFLVLASILTVVVVFYARGYRPDFNDRTVQATGIVSIKSSPEGAVVFINDEEKGKTNIDIANLKPGTYTIGLVKEGFSTWEKEIVVKKEAVNTIEAVLFPVAPSLRALTFTGVKNPLSAPDGKRIVFLLEEPKEKAGVWSLNLSTSPLPSFFTESLIFLAVDTQEARFSASTYEFSPDSKQLLVKLPEVEQYFLIDPSKRNEDPKEVTLDLEKIKKTWEDQSEARLDSFLKPLGKTAQNLASGLTSLSFSPDRTKFLGKKGGGPTVVYDSKPAADPNAKPITYNLPPAETYSWFPDNDHVILVQEASVSIVELTGANKITIYTGSFARNLVVPWPDGSRIVVVANFNSALNKLPNLYAIELR